jgi:hypothetical protein
LSPEQKIFVRAVADGMETIEACRKAWPSCERNKRDIDVRLATVMENPKVLNAIHWLTQWKTNEDLLTAGVAAVLNDPKAKPAQKLAALKMLGTIGGTLKTEVEKVIGKGKKTQRLKQPDLPDTELHEKLKELKQKAARPN